ncbi:hypothetical protein NVS55_28640 [Myxococcus stipitatus]|uniref:hypothetical protein n=1 Tax=Myxococcus stipitatus TaxID=83455 RepID=UPI003144EFD5
MRNFVAVAVSVVSLSLFGCNNTSPEPVQEPAPETSEQTQGMYVTGSGCEVDADCDSGLCWHEADSYPLYNPYWIRASSCTEECGGPDDHESCRLLGLSLNAPYPNTAKCIPARGVYDDGDDSIVYVCDMLSMGLGSVAWVE